MKGHPMMTGLRDLQGFSVYPPLWVYWIDDVIVTKTITFDGSLSIGYDISGTADLWVRPLITDLVHEVLRDPRPVRTDERDGFRWGDLFLKGPSRMSPALKRTGTSGTNGNMNGDTQRLRTCILRGFSRVAYGMLLLPSGARGMQVFRTPSPARHRRRLCLNGWNGHQVHSAMATRYMPATTGFANHGVGIPPSA